MIDVFVIGAGPAGLSAAINAKVSGKTVKVIGNPDNYLSKAEKIDNYLGLYAVSGKDMMKAFVQHANKVGVEIQKDTVLKILPMKKSFMINVGLDVVEAKTVILALGVITQKQIEGEKEFLGRGVSYCATCDGMLYRGKNVLVYGLNEESAYEANQLVKIGVNVKFISPKKKELELDEKIEVINDTIQKVSAHNKKLIVTLKNNTLETDGLFILRPSIAPDTIVDKLELEDGYIKVDRNMMTNIKGLFAAGDCTGKPLQISKAVGEGLVAAQVASHYIDKLKEEN